MSNCFLLLMISISFINGMETNKSKFSFSIVSHGTKINLSKSSKLSDNIDLVFTGAREERIPSYYGPLHGLNRYCEENGLNRYRKENVGILGDFKLYDNPNIKIPIVGIIEPEIKTVEVEKHIFDIYIESRFRCFKTPDTRLEYNVCRELCTKTLTFTGEKAIEEASNDLVLCYNNALKMGLERLKSIEKKNIAFTTPSTNLGFCSKKAAAIAINTILEFVKNNPNAYNSITFYARDSLKDIDNAYNGSIYRLLFAQYITLIYKICSLYCAHTKDGNILMLLPRKIIHPIAHLLYQASMPLEVPRFELPF